MWKRIVQIALLVGALVVIGFVGLMVVLSVVFWRAASDDDAKAPVGEPGTERDLPEVQDERQVQAGVQVAEMRQ